jgi:hypothetical protein
MFPDPTVHGNGGAHTDMFIHTNQRKDAVKDEDNDTGGFLSSINGAQNDFAANRSDEFNKATDEKPGGIFT